MYYVDSCVPVYSLKAMLEVVGKSKPEENVRKLEHYIHIEKRSNTLYIYATNSLIMIIHTTIVLDDEKDYHGIIPYWQVKEAIKDKELHHKVLLTLETITEDNLSCMRIPFELTVPTEINFRPSILNPELLYKIHKAACWIMRGEYKKDFIHDPPFIYNNGMDNVIVYYPWLESFIALIAPMKIDEPMLPEWFFELTGVKVKVKRTKNIDVEVLEELISQASKQV